MRQRKKKSSRRCVFRSRPLTLNRPCRGTLQPRTGSRGSEDLSQSAKQAQVPVKLHLWLTFSFRATDPMRQAERKRIQNYSDDSFETEIISKKDLFFFFEAVYRQSDATGHSFSSHICFLRQFFCNFLVLKYL